MSSEVRAVALQVPWAFVVLDFNVGVMKDNSVIFVRTKLAQIDRSGDNNLHSLLRDAARAYRRIFACILPTLFLLQFTLDSDTHPTLINSSRR